MLEELDELTALDGLEELDGLEIGDQVVTKNKTDVIQPKPAQPVQQQAEEEEADLLNEMMAL